MKIIKPYKTFADSRGIFTGIVNSGRWEEINYIETGAGHVRGGHYHKETRELFFIIEGEIDIKTFGIDGKEMDSVTVGKGAIVLVEPLEVHTFSCRTESRWINVLSKRIDDEFRDIHLPDTT